MNDMQKHIRAVLEFETDLSYPFPSAEMLSMALFVLTIIGVAWQGSSIGFLVFPDPYWSLLELARVADFVRLADFFSLVSPVFNAMVLIIALVPLLSAFRVAGPIENGTLGAVLSYPIGRRSLLAVKGFQITLFTCLPVTAGALIAVSFLTSASVTGETFMLLSSLWLFSFEVLSVSLVLSIVLQSSAKAAFGGMGIWAALLIVAVYGNLPVIIRGVLNPVNLVINYVTGVGYFGNPIIGASIEEVFASMVGALLISVASILLSFRLFERVEL